MSKELAYLLELDIFDLPHKFSADYNKNLSILFISKLSIQVPPICEYMSEFVKLKKVSLSFQWMHMMCGRGKLSNRLGTQPNGVHHLGDDRLIIHSALLGIAAGLLALHSDRVYHSTYSKGQFELAVA